MLHAIRTAYPGLVLDSDPPTNTSAPTSPTDATSPVPSLSRSILSASDTSPNGWVTLELPQVTSPTHSPTPSNTKSDEDCPAHVRFHDTCLIIPDTPIKSPGLAARMLGVGAWSTKRRVSDPDREQSPTGAALLGVRLPGLGRKPKHNPCDAPPCAPVVLRPCLVHRSSSQNTPNLSASISSVPIATSRPRFSTTQSTPQTQASSSLPTVLVRTPTRANSLPPPSSFTTIPLRKCCPDCIRACTQLEGTVQWSAGAKRKRREDRAEREREAKAGLRDSSANTAFGWEDMLVLDGSDASESEAGPSVSSAYQRRSTSPPPSSLASRRCGASAARALKHPHALPCPLPRVCPEDDTDEEALFPLPVSPRSMRSPCSRSPGGKSPKGTSSSNTPSPAGSDEVKCAGAKDPAKCAEVIAAKCAEKAKVEVVGPAVRRLLQVQQASFEGHRLSPVPASEENTPRSGTPTFSERAPMFSERKEEREREREERGRKLDMALVGDLRVGSPPVSGSGFVEGRPGHGRRRSSSASSVGRTLGALVRGVAAGVSGGQPM